MTPLRWIGLAGASLMLLHMACDSRGSWPVVNHPPAPGPMLAFGDSLTVGHGAPAGEGYTDHLGRKVGRMLVVHGRNGDTAEQALDRLEAAVSARPAVVIITLGGNDIMKKVPRSRTRAALATIFGRFQQAGAMVAWCGLEPPFVDPAWVEEMAALCQETGVIYVPDVLEDVWLDPSAKADPIHPNAKGYASMAERVAGGLAPYLAGS